MRFFKAAVALQTCMASAYLLGITSKLPFDCLQSFMERNTEFLVMPRWEKQELREALPLYPEVSEFDMDFLYDKWGGVIRWCLANALWPTNDDSLELGIQSTSLAALQAAIGSQAAFGEVCASRCAVDGGSACRWPDCVCPYPCHACLLAELAR